MKKLLIFLVLLFFCVNVFAFEHIQSARLELSHDNWFWVYDFFSVDINSPADILLLGLYVGSGSKLADAFGLVRNNPARIIENNTGLPQELRDRMQRVNANVSISVRNMDLYVHILMPNGRYITIIYV